MFSKKKLVLGSLILGVLGFSPMLMSVVGKGNKKGELEINPDYYKNKKESLFKKTDKNDELDC